MQTRAIIRGTAGPHDPMFNDGDVILKNNAIENVPASITRWLALGRTIDSIEVFTFRAPVSRAHVPAPAPVKRASSADIGVIARRQNAGGLSGAVLSRYPTFR